MRATFYGIPFLITLSAATAGAREGKSIDYATARFERRLQAVRATGTIEIDGALDEADWKAAPVATRFIQNEPHEGEPLHAARSQADGPALRAAAGR